MIAVPGIPSAPGLSWAFAPALPPGWELREYGALQSLIQGTSTVICPSPGQGGISSTWSVASMADLGQRRTVRNWNVGCTHCRAAFEFWQFRVPNTRSLFPVRRVSRCSLVSAAMVSKFDVNLKWHLCPPYALWLCRRLRTSTNNNYSINGKNGVTQVWVFFWWAIYFNICWGGYFGGSL